MLIVPGKRVVVDLSETGLQPGTVFLLSSNTVWGTDAFYEAQQFKYDPLSFTMAVASRKGSVINGVLEWQGVKTYGIFNFDIGGERLAEILIVLFGLIYLRACFLSFVRSFRRHALP